MMEHENIVFLCQFFVKIEVIKGKIKVKLNERRKRLWVELSIIIKSFYYSFSMAFIHFQSVWRVVLNLPYHNVSSLENICWSFVVYELDIHLVVAWSFENQKIYMYSENDCLHKLRNTSFTWFSIIQSKSITKWE
jgi:hypothetical protein